MTYSVQTMAHISLVLNAFLFSVEALQNISDRYAIGFGGFADKRALPYALPSDDPKTYQARVGLT